MTTKTNKTTKTARDQNMITGLQKHFSGASLVIAGKSYTMLELIDMLQGRLAAFAATGAARAKWLAMVEAEREKEKETNKLVSNLRSTVIATVPASIDVLSDFGIAPRKQTTPKPATKVLSTKRALATRAARHTMSAKQKLAIKGEVPQASPAIATPPHAPAAAPASPATPTPPNGSPGAPTPGQP